MKNFHRSFIRTGRIIAYEKNNEMWAKEMNMKQLKAEGKEKSATYRQLMGNKLQYQNMLSLYKIYGLLEEA